MIYQLDLFEEPEVSKLKTRIIALEIDNKKSNAEIKRLKKQVKELTDRINAIEFGLDNYSF